MNTYVYSIEEDGENAKTLYVNLTNKCTNNCVFCIRTTVDDIKGKNLWLENYDVTANDVEKQFEKFNTPEEVVFCGFGEPLIKADVLKEVSKFVKDKFDAKVRINTNGHANVINKKNILPELKGLVDEISVSLNASNSQQYNDISNPKFQNAYDEVKDFIKKSVEEGFDTTATVVDGHPEYKIDIQACEDVAKSLGAKFRVRKWLNNGY